MAESRALHHQVQAVGAMLEMDGAVIRGHEVKDGVATLDYSTLGDEAVWRVTIAPAAEAAGLAVVPVAELERLRRQVAALEADPDRIGFCVVTWNQASHCPELDFPDLHWGPGAMESAEGERDHKAAETARLGRGERHEVAAVMSIGEDGDG